MTTGARGVAYRALQRIEHDGGYANLVLPSMLAASDLDHRDRAFATNLVYGTTRRRRACDFLVDRFVAKAPAPELRTLLRMGAFQLAFGGVEPHAAVSTTVALAPPRARGFVNAVLRNVARTPSDWPDDATRLSYPDWIVARLRRELGPDEALAALERMNEPPPVTERADGYVQDLASTWVADLVEAQPGERVADLCAAPGGKATRLATGAGFVVAADLRLSRAGLIAANTIRLGIDNLATVVADAATPPFRPESLARVLIDAPCSGLGALRRRPDARWRIEEPDVDRLATLQRRMLDAATALVVPGGVLVYSVCTLTAAESIDHRLPPGWVPLPTPGPPWRPYGDGARLLPQDADTDGMVVLRYRRRP
jgi:16S rRNA (cytosine967-C5)-methyltransferase